MENILGVKVPTSSRTNAEDSLGLALRSEATKGQDRDDQSKVVPPLYRILRCYRNSNYGFLWK